MYKMKKAIIAETGNNVACVDINKANVEILSAGESTICCKEYSHWNANS
jgi:UDP-glucose 6-dehydrogenase